MRVLLLHHLVASQSLNKTKKLFLIHMMSDGSLLSDPCLSVNP